MLALEVCFGIIKASLANNRLMMASSNTLHMNNVFDVLFPTASLILIVNGLMSSMALGNIVFLSLALMITPIVFATSGQMFEACSNAGGYKRLKVFSAYILRIAAVVMALTFGPSICFQKMLISSGVDKMACSASLLALVVFGLIELKALISKVKVKIKL